MPRLSISSGRDAGRDFELQTETAKIGRHPENDLVLDDGSASRFHAHIVRLGDRCYVRDVGSTLGTFVNGVRIAEDCELNDNDQIRIGHTELRYLTSKRIERKSEQALVGTIAATAWFDPAEQIAGLDQQSIMFSLPSSAEVSPEQLSARRSEMLAEVAHTIQSEANLDALLSKLLELVFEVFDPDRGVVLLFDQKEGGELIPQVSLPAGTRFTISRTIVNHAIDNRVSLLVSNAGADERFAEAESICAQSIQAAVCAPLVCRNRVLGVLYIDTQVDVLMHDSDDLALLNLIAANAAIAIENAVLIQEKLEATRLGAEDPEPIIAHSSLTQTVQQRIEELAGISSPVLISGRPGTGKLFAAKTIHCAAGDRNAPFCVVDCSDLTAESAATVLFGGSDADSRTPAGSQNGGWNGNAVKRASGGTLVLRHVSALDPTSQQRLFEFLESQESTESPPKTRVLATTYEDVRTLAASGCFDTSLAQKLCENVLEMPTLHERKEDLVPLARYFLSRSSRRSREYRAELNASAEKALKRSQFRYRNVAELREAVELASAIVDGPEIGAEHIFTGPQGIEPRPEFDLTRFRVTRWFASPAVAVLLKTAVLTLFLAITALCLGLPEASAGQVANVLVWGLWWPALMLLFLFVGRVWCAVCPIARVGRIAQSVFCLNRRPPQWIKERTNWILAGLFVLIVWSEQVFHMSHEPVGTGFLLLTLMALAVAFSVTCARDVWCRYVCPLGGLAACYSLPAPLYVRANPSLCAMDCKTECFKGGDSNSGCPMYHHPLFVRDSHFCKLCFECLRNCPNESVRLYLRPPLQDVWRLEELNLTLAPLALVTFFLTVVLLAHGYLDNAMTFTGATCFAVAAAGMTSAVLPRLLSPERDPAVAARAAFGLLLLAWGPLTAFHLANVPGLETLRIDAPAGSIWEESLPLLSQVSFLGILQFGAIAFACLLSVIAFWRIRARCAKQGIPTNTWGWRAVYAASATYLMGTIALLMLAPRPV